MMPLTTNIISVLLSLAAISFVGMSVIVFRHLDKAKGVTKEEITAKLNLKRFLVKDIYCSAKNYLGCLWKNYFLPFFYKITEKIVLKLEGVAKVIENRLTKLSNYIKGKRKIKNSAANSEYWGDIIEFKNGLNGNGENKKDNS